MASFIYRDESARPVTGIDDLLGRASGITKDGRVYFRGQADIDWGLTPSICREYWHAGKKVRFTRDDEIRLFQRFRRRAYIHFQRVQTRWETLFLARHYGLPVRLIDWSENPLVALFNASDFVREEDLPDGAIWAMTGRGKGRHAVDVFGDDDPFSVEGVKIVHPMAISQRLVAQGGIFTIHDPWKKPDLVDHGGEEMPDEFLDIGQITRWRVRREDKGKFLGDLDRMGVNQLNLYPDLENLATGLQDGIVREAIYREKEGG